MTFVQTPKLLLGLALILKVVPKALPKAEKGRPPEAETTVAFLSHNGFEAHGEQRRFGAWSTPLRASAGYEF